MSEFLNILLLSGAMFVGCMVSGYVPLMFTLSQKSIQRCTILGAGLLVGTALAVIIPEGVEVMYNDHHEHAATNEVIEKDDSGTKSAAENFLHRHINAVVPDERESIEPIKPHEDYYHQHHHDGKENIHRAVGASLLLGFIFMLLVDQCGGSHAHSHEPVDASPQTKPVKSGKSFTATLGLVVHAAADGVALGAAANTAKTDLQLIVFFAIMLHKAPAAFGLVSFLMHENVEKRRIKQYLLVFALAAPVLAILTFLQLNQVHGKLNTNINGTGVAMLFSGGTFLYVSTIHVLPEVAHSNSSSGLTRQDVLFLLAGAILPLILNLTHSH